MSVAATLMDEPGAWPRVHHAGPPLAALDGVPARSVLAVACHAAQSRSDDPRRFDPMAERIMARLRPALARSSDPLHRRLAAGKIDRDLRAYLVARARRYDHHAREFSARHPGGRVVNLGCGLDTRFWRIDDGRVRVLDLDRPPVIALKRLLVEPHDRYYLVGSSVLDTDWMHALAVAHEGPFLFLAEGLFVTLPEADARSLVLELHRRFRGSELVCEVQGERWLCSPWKAVVDFETRHRWGRSRDAEFRFGVEDPRELETWADGIRWLGDWVYRDEDEEKIGLLGRFRRRTMLGQVPWTVHYALGAPPRG